MRPTIPSCAGRRLGARRPRRAVPTSPPEQMLDETFTFRNVFAPTVTPPTPPDETSSDSSSSSSTSETAERSR